ncbi:MAG: rhodanese-like domain-containing protein [Methanothrix sp.]|uniref:Rhodanese domain protein n=1 Tax=Methanothrix harundinacea TaxID=301375 RepID=A0A101IIR1_9EURY|nr:MAG: Rhodanese domain protein [Methanothrix harundinacea]KUK95884.1 MAG: Rhodanese domain protein [Methanothrix harundinacea]MDD2637529.1 rhodanese-like domain-containing protein [Methanothrix sp.]MDD3709133.1 rhodanese-like domain-containing protein [Methanothrix sp.]MDI9398285.1 rhodanese-like domain-containing protein [Euryarchaeota archaeon]
MRSKLAMLESVLIVMIALASGAQAGCSSCGGGEGVWDGPTWIEATLSGSSDEAATSSGMEAGAVLEVKAGAEEGTEAEPDTNDEICAPSITAEELRERLEGDSRPVIAYVSNTPIRGSYIEGSIALPSKSLIRADGSLKSIDELARVLGKAGISEGEDLVIYGNCFSCGDATFVYWIMKYLGHQNVAVLRGSQQDWSATGISQSRGMSATAEDVYIPDPRPELLADYKSVASGDLVIVDARAPDQFGASHIDGAINIDYNRVIEGFWLKDDSALSEIFVDLKEDRPVAVYTKNGGQASIVWYALILQGYDASLYTWNDWLRHQS